MRRTSIVTILLLLTVFAAAPAWAQGRDPFEPQPGSEIDQPDPGGSSERDPFNPEEGGQDPVAQPTPDDPTEPVVQPTVDPAPTQAPAPDDDAQAPLANTGFDVTTWGAIAYLMIVVGLAAIVAARTFAPATPRRHR